MQTDSGEKQLAKRKIANMGNSLKRYGKRSV